MKLTDALHFPVLLVLGLLTACGGGGGSDTPSPGSGNPQAASEAIEIVGAGIKGPLAFADAKVFVLDPSLSDGYDKNSPISSTMTDQYAQIAGLSVPQTIKPPYVLTIGGQDAIDLNTGKRPVITTLVTVITEEMLKGRKPVYATPLTTLAFQMARHASNADTSATNFVQQLKNAATNVSRQFAIDQSQPIDILNSPLVINDSTDTLAKQKEAVYHRASLEAFAAKVYALSVPRGDGLKATYFNNSNLSQAVVVRVDATVDFDWAQNTPTTGINAENFSVRWTGLVQPEFSEDYTFYTSTDDGVRLWIDGKLIIDHWSDQPATEYQATLPLTGGKKYSIVMEYYENKKNAVAKLMWSSTGQPKAIIGKEYLYSVKDPALLKTFTTENIIDRIALDLQSDNVIDSTDNGSPIEGIDLTVINQDPMKLPIPNSPYNIEDTITLMEDERVLIGTDKGPALQVAEIGFGSKPDTSPVVPDPVVTPDPVVIPDPVVTPEPAISFSATTINFGNVIVGGVSDPVPLSITNTGTGSLIISNISASGEFTQTNDCNGNVLAGKSCTIYLTFTPITSGNVSRTLIINGNTTTTPDSVSLLGVGDIGSQPANNVLYADFENLTQGPYKESDLRSDFRVGQGGFNDTVHGPDWNSMDIVSDPAGTGRSNVVRVIHRKGKGGASASAGGFRFRADLPPADEYYFAYDYYVASDWWQPLQHKMPALINGTLLEASHATGVTPTPETLVAFNGRIQSFSDSAYARGDGSLAAVVYDKESVQQPEWFNEIDPTSEDKGGQYLMPRGQWVRIEEYMKVNTGGQKNGVLKIWMNGVLVTDKPHRWRDASSKRLIDGIYMYSFYGGNYDDPRNQSPRDQYQYYDNFIVSDSPITH